MVLKYLVIKPLLFIIGIIDFFIDCCDSNKRNKFKSLPQKPPYSIEISHTENSKTYRSFAQKTPLKITNQDANIYNECYKASIKYSNQSTLGVREILSIEDQTQTNGKVFKKFNLKNEYQWTNYKDVMNTIDSMATGLLQIGLKSNDNIIIFSETRREWLISAIACFKIKVRVVTLYSTLGLDALAYGINETKAAYIIASGESLLKIQKILDKVPTLKQIIVLTDKSTEQNAINFRTSANKVLVYTFKEIIEIGLTSSPNEHFEQPTKDDIAIIMYTSGSTGNPKGVMISHGNLLTTVKAVVPRIGDLNRQDIYIAYLPLAHVLELMCELSFFINGVSIGYSSPFTLSDVSTAIKEGQKGDLRVLRPTLMACVPTVLERLSKGVHDKLLKEKKLKRELIELASKKKLEKLKSEKSSTLLDKIIFSKINEAVFGGSLRAIISAGALLNKEVHEFSQTYFAQVIQAYGLTETCGGGTTQFGYETQTEQVGSVIECSNIMLVDWPEGNYKSTDKPNPRGEIWIGGDNVTMGYYNLPEKTKEDFHIINGMRYFATGDIGEMLRNGNLKIIDRKKDLVKLQGGEYVSLNKVEAVIKLLPYVENCCVIADPKKSFCVCLISPNLKTIESLLSTVQTQNETSAQNAQTLAKRRSSLDLINEFIEILEKNQDLKAKFNKEILDHCLKQGLASFEIPARARFVKEAWLPDTGLVTDSLKLKRKEIEKFYQKEIEILYAV